MSSVDNGNTWESEKSFTSDLTSEYYCSIVSVSNSDVIAFYTNYDEENFHNYIYKKVSSDGGLTWSQSIPISNSENTEAWPNALIDSEGTIWLVFSAIRPNNTLGFFQVEVCYTKSTDGGNTWETPDQFTKYKGYDFGDHAILLDNRPFITFISNRWSDDYYDYKVWYGLIGVTQDNNAPPVFLEFNSQVQSNLSFYLQAFVDDETGISEVKAEINLNGVNQGTTQFYDDGIHNDSSANDNIWGATIGPFESAKPEDSVKIYLTITDKSNNNIALLPSNGKIEIPAVHNSGNIILSLHGNSQIGEGGYVSSGLSGHWPKNNGSDYLTLGGLWIGANISGTKKVMNFDYNENDWWKVENTHINISSGISDQDADLYYEDILAPDRIGLKFIRKATSGLMKELIIS